MNESPDPANEPDRLAALTNYTILDSLPESDYDDITSLAADICQTPTALITLVDEKRQWFKSRQGFGLAETAREFSFCVHSFGRPDEPMVVPDARNDIRFADNPLVTGDPHIVFYAGAPLVNEDGHALGALCVIDTTPRELSPRQLLALQKLARQVITLLSLRKANQALRQSQERYAQVTNQQQHTQSALTESEINFRSLIEEAPVATSLYVGRELRIEMANQVMIDTLGKGWGIVGQPLALALPELADQPFLGILDEVFINGTTYHAKSVPATLQVDGILQVYYFDITHKPLRNGTGQVYGILNMVTDVTEQVLVHQRLAQVQQDILTSFAESPVAIALVSGDDLRFGTVNPFYSQLVGRPIEELEGKPLLEALPELAGQGFDRLLHRVMTTGEPHIATETPADVMRQHQMERIYVDLTYKPYQEVNNSVKGVLMIATDVTAQVLSRQVVEAREAQLRQLATELEQRVAERTQELLHANQDLMRSNENLQQFTYIASHDLQEPLRKIQSFSTLLEERFGANLGDDGRDLLERMRSAGSRMSRLIKDLLIFSRISTRQQAFGLVSLNDIISTVLTTLDLTIGERDAQVTIDELPRINGDESQLSQLLQNLLTNALKFTLPDQRPVITVTARRCERCDLPVQLRPTSPASQFWQLEVRDQGIGFEQKYTDRIFQVFQRLHGKQQYAGTGVGLAICQRVVENHGGCITARSEPGQGATFTVYLPT